MRAAPAMLGLLAIAALGLAACPRAGEVRPAPEPEPVAEPAPIEIDWPDAGAPDPDPGPTRARR